MTEKIIEGEMSIRLLLGPVKFLSERQVGLKKRIRKEVSGDPRYSGSLLHGVMIRNQEEIWTHDEMEMRMRRNELKGLSILGGEEGSHNGRTLRHIKL
ncbi:unnamed protein product [Allacma fusca]|uniref:Uncharacterized protein n=1 Tax=Allacma fusca TaxID=39272 RepID=A0A8J2KEP6_9HEXA|nr:unnamed protein product [Allacma fusca]